MTVHDSQCYSERKVRERSETRDTRRPSLTTSPSRHALTSATTFFGSLRLSWLASLSTGTMPTKPPPPLRTPQSLMECRDSNVRLLLSYQTYKSPSVAAPSSATQTTTARNSSRALAAQQRDDRRTVQHVALARRRTGRPRQRVVYFHRMWARLRARRWSSLCPTLRILVASQRGRKWEQPDNVWAGEGGLTIRYSCKGSIRSCEYASGPGDRIWHTSKGSQGMSLPFTPIGRMHGL